MGVEKHYPESNFPWPMIEMPFRDPYLASESAYAAQLLQRFIDSGIDMTETLIAGIADIRPVGEVGSFGGRRTTFALTPDELRQAASDIDQYGSSLYEYPPLYAEEAVDGPDHEREPVIVAFRAGMFTPVDEVRTAGDTEWQLREGVTMDGAVMAILRLIDTP